MRQLRCGNKRKRRRYQTSRPQTRYGLRRLQSARQLQHRYNTGLTMPQTPTQYLSELCGQLLIGGYDGAEPSRSFLDALARKRRAGAILFRRNLASWRCGYEASRLLRNAAGNDVCPIVAIDQEGGRVARLGAPVLRVPAMATVARRGDAELVRRIAGAVADQLRHIGFNMNFAPVADVDTNPRNPVIGDRAFSSNPQVVEQMVTAWIGGSQEAVVAACAKHFPGHGDTELDSHFELPRIKVDRARLSNVELPPFQAAVNARVDAIMTAHIVVESVDAERPATMCLRMLRDRLRRDMGFQGLIVSDDLEMKAIADRWTIEEAAVQAIRAGCDVLLICKDEALQHRAHEALIQQAEVDREFRAHCEHAANRCRDLRQRRPIPRVSARQVEDAFAKQAALQCELDELAMS